MARIELPCLHAAVRATHGSVQGEAMVLLYHRLFADFRWYLATHQGSRSDGIVTPSVLTVLLLNLVLVSLLLLFVLVFVLAILCYFIKNGFVD